LRYLFGECSLDPTRRELRRGHEVVHVEPQVFDLLLLLIRNRDRVVSSDDLIAAVWKGRIVSSSTLSSRISAVRRAIGDNGGRPRLIETFPKRGLRFTGDVREEPSRTDGIEQLVREPVDDHAPRSRSLTQAITFCRTADGFNLAVSSAGQGPVLVRTTHWLSHVEYDWQSPATAPFLHALAGIAHLVRYDGRGVGLSDRDVPIISPATLQTDLEAVADSLGLERFALLGTSQGAATALTYAARHPDRVSKVIVQGAYALGRNKRGTPTDAEESKMIIAMMQRGWGDQHSAFMRAYTTLFLPNGTAEQIKAHADLQRVATSPKNAVKIRTLIDETDIRPLLPKVRVPTIVFHSRYDSVVPFEQGRLVAASIPNAKFIPLDSDNHVLLRDEPAYGTFMEGIREFLAASS
jgi:DNA-binding winged helix-turn-helix (wHTH) protein/pimeloyl-ACP methyl ester carboxylesterase